ncbi:MAG TPA: hypothetical protein VF263_19685 [Longimicrobiaceae bacterium]
MSTLLGIVLLSGPYLEDLWFIFVVPLAILLIVLVPLAVWLVRVNRHLRDSRRSDDRP